MRITALLENTARRGDVQAEHGLSLFIETAHHTILFDMGQTDLFAKNAEALGIDLAAVDVAVLSHGHYDHGGGLRTFLELNSRASVYMHKDAFLPHYNGTEKYIGLDPALAPCERIRFVDGARRIGSHLHIAPLPSCFEASPASGLTERVGDAFIPDDFRHEQYLRIEEGERRVLISGCSHRGVFPLLEVFRPHVLVGGFHYSKHPRDGALADVAERLAAFPTEFYTCHCTGEAQYAFMKERMPNLHYLSCGETIEIK